MKILTREQVFLLALSRMVWAKRDAAKSSGLSFNEETITETILLDLKTTYPGHVQIVAFNKAQEATTGADWLWSFVSADGRQSLTMLVQAKRLEDAEQLYRGIGRQIGKRTPPVRQIDQLLETARSQQVPAIYAFYNHVTNVSRIPRNCGSLPPTDPDQVHGFGISVAEASTVARALPDEAFDTHRRHSIPLHCLLCNGGQVQRLGGGTPEAIAAALTRLRSSTLSEKDEPDASGFSLGLHPTVENALQLAARRTEGLDYMTPDDLPDIAGVIVLQDTEEVAEPQTGRR